MGYLQRVPTGTNTTASTYKGEPMNYLKQAAGLIAQPHQMAPLDERQIENAAGGFVYKADDWARLSRFLILGAESGTYYVGAQTLTADNVLSLRACIASDGPRTVATIVQVSEDGRAPKNDPAIFALAMCAAAPDVATRRAALDALPRVCRTATHLFQFLTFAQAFRGWGRSLRRAVGEWYASKTPDDLAYQLVKYRQRDGWTHRDALRLAHPGRRVGEGNPRTAVTADHESLLSWVTHGGVGDGLPAIIEGFTLAQAAETPAETARLIRTFNLPREAVKPEHLTDPDVWAALLDSMPMTAMIRNLANMTRAGLLVAGADATRTVVERLSDGERLRKARVHPISVLGALKTYRAGRGVRGTNTWTPVGRVVDGLDAAFYGSFATVQPTGKRQLVAVDVSGSMRTPVNGMDFLSAHEAAAAVALVSMAADPNTTTLVAFDTNVYPLDITPRMRLDDVVKAMSKWGGGTDCDAPIRWAESRRLQVDGAIVVTDSETWAGPRHVARGLVSYREKIGSLRAVCLATAATGSRLGDPNDGNYLDVAGFDASAVQVSADFIAGRV